MKIEVASRRGDGGEEEEVPWSEFKAGDEEQGRKRANSVEGRMKTK